LQWYNDFQSRLHVGQLKWSFPDLVHGKTIAVFTHVQYLAETLLRKMLWETPVIMASLSPKVPENAHCI